MNMLIHVNKISSRLTKTFYSNYIGPALSVLASGYLLFFLIYVTIFYFVVLSMKGSLLEYLIPIHSSVFNMSLGISMSIITFVSRIVIAGYVIHYSL